MANPQLSEIVDVQITRGDAQLSRLGFGTLLAVADGFAETASGTAIVKSYASLAEVLDDGFTSSTELYKVAAAYFGQTTKPRRLMLGDYDEADPVASLQAIQAVSDDWYGLYVADDMSSGYQGRMLDIAEWIEAQQKIFGAKTKELNTIDVALEDDDPETGTLAAQLKALARTRTFLLLAGAFNSTNAQNWQAAWFGKMFPYDPGSATWAHKELSGVAPAAVAPVSMTTEQRDNAFAKNVNIYTTISGRNDTRWGTMASGEYIDVIVGIDWLRQRIAEEVYRLFVSTAKVPFTDDGIARVESVIRAQLIAAQASNVIAPDALDVDNITVIPGFTITVPRVVDTDEADRTQRLLTGVRFNARLAGAIHKVEISGIVAV